MDSKAHSILVGVIKNHGEQLITSNAFCKVYLTGYLADFTAEKELLTALKVSELPAVLNAHKISELSETELFEAVDKISANVNTSDADIAWGVDAWAAAVGLDDSTRTKIRQVCFPDESKLLHCALPDATNQLSQIDEALLSEQATSVPTRKSRFGFGAKLIAHAAVISAIVVIQVFGSSDSQEIVVVEERSHSEVPVPEVLDVQPIASLYMLDSPTHPRVDLIPFPAPLSETTDIEDLNVVQLDKPKPLVEEKNLELVRKQAADKLVADTEAFLRYGN